MTTLDLIKQQHYQGWLDFMAKRRGFVRLDLLLLEHIKIAVKDDPEETSLSGLAGGCCFDFNKTQEHLFIVGTEEGNIHKCSKAKNDRVRAIQNLHQRHGEWNMIAVPVYSKRILQASISAIQRFAPTRLLGS